MVCMRLEAVGKKNHTGRLFVCLPDWRTTGVGFAHEWYRLFSMFSELAMSLGTETVSDGIGSLFRHFPPCRNPVPALSAAGKPRGPLKGAVLLLLNRFSSLRVLSDPVLKPL